MVLRLIMYTLAPVMPVSLVALSICCLGLYMIVLF